MAEINIQRKSTSWLWWVLGIVAVLLIVWAIASMWNTRTEPTEPIGLMAPVPMQQLAGAALGIPAHSLG